MAVELGLEDRVAAAGLLGRVHRDVGALLERLVVLAVHRVQRDADAGVDLQAHALEHERLAQVREQVLGDGGRVLGLLDAREQDAELVAAEAGDRVGVAQRGAAAGCETSCSSRSPMWWPSVSLISLK